MFLDEAIVKLSSGSGGSGASSFHREKFMPYGGPNGADGGRGGDITFIADHCKRTLYDLKMQHEFVAGNGSQAVQNHSGKKGKSIEIRVPVGTMVFDQLTDECIVDLKLSGQKCVICKGGRGGHGNLHYVSSVRQAPTLSEKGEPGETLTVRLELKLLADVGLIGLPNAGKSTLLSVVSAAKPKIANYPFTTLIPNLGVVQIKGETFTMADMPGLIEGASQNIGLGYQFLRHIERTKVLIHVVDLMPMDLSDPVSNYELVEKELEVYSNKVYNKPRLIALNKIDLLSQDDQLAFKEIFESYGHPIFLISGVSQVGIENLLYAALDKINSSAELEIEEEIIFRPSKREEQSTNQEWSIEKIDEGYKVNGNRVERLVAMTHLDNSESLLYLQRRLERMGIIESLKEHGINEGDTVVINEFMFEFKEQV